MLVALQAVDQNGDAPILRLSIASREFGSMLNGMHNKPLREIRKEDLDALMSAPVSESETLDYKSEFSSTKQDRRFS